MLGFISLIFLNIHSIPINLNDSILSDTTAAVIDTIDSTSLMNDSFVIEEIKEALNRNEGCEFRSFGSFRTNIQKASIRRNPKTGEKVSVPKKRTIKWKMSKDLFKKLNNEKE